MNIGMRFKPFDKREIEIAKTEMQNCRGVQGVGGEGTQSPISSA